MVVLHIAKMQNNPASGVSVVVPNHVKAQSQYATVGLLAFAEYCPDNVDNCFVYSQDFSLENLDAPFNKPDIVIFHQVYVTEYIKIAKQLRKKKIPYIIVPHGSLAIEAQKIKRLKKIAGNVLFGPFIRHASAIQCLSENELNNTKFKATKFIGTNGCVIPSKQKTSFNKDKVKFVYVGRLYCHIKGIDIMLDAFKLLMDSPYKDMCEISIYGPNYQGRHTYIEQMISERSLNEIVTLNPGVFGLEKENVLLDSDVFIQTSRSEAMPMGILEALSYGVPCLVTEGTTLGKFIENYNAGWSAKTDAQSVFENIIRALDEREALNEKSNGATKLIAANFAWDKVAADHINAYRKYANLGER